MLFPPSAKLPEKVGIGFGFLLLLITNSSPWSHLEQKQDAGQAITSPHVQRVPILEICPPLTAVLPTSTKRNTRQTDAGYLLLRCIVF